MTAAVLAQRIGPAGIETAEQLPEPEIVAAELADRGAAHQLHVALNLGAQQAEGPLDAGLAGRRQRIEIGAADADGLGTERQGLQHVRAALHAAVHQHVDAIADGIESMFRLSPEDRDQMGERGRRFVAETFAYETISARIESVVSVKRSGRSGKSLRGP